MYRTSVSGDEYGKCATKFPNILMFDKKNLASNPKIFTRFMHNTFLVHSKSLCCCYLVSLFCMRGFTTKEIVNNCPQNVCDTNNSRKEKNCMKRTYEEIKEVELGCDCPLVCQSTDYILTN